MSFVGDMFGGGGSDTSDASREAAGIAAASEQEKLNYLKEINKLPTQLRDQAMQQLGGAYGLEGFGDVDLTQQAMQSPLYQAQIGNIDQMTQRAIDQSMASASATGGLRGGNLQRGFGDIAEQETLARGNALGQAYNQQLTGLGGLAGLDTGQKGIAESIGNVGNIQAQGIIGGAQSQQAGQQAGFGNLMGLGGLGLQAYSAFNPSAGGGSFSDTRLKDSIELARETSNPDINFYSWHWNSQAEELGLTGSESGYLAQEVEKVWPELVHEHANGFKYIDKAAIDKRLGV